MDSLELTIGSDPELVIVNDDRHPCSAIRVLKNNKDNPYDLGEGIKLYADNALAEISFPPAPPDCIVGVIAMAINKAKKALKEFTLMAQAATVFDEDELKAALLDAEGKPIITAWEIGCNPNYDAYRFAPNPKGSFTDGLRTGSFHIHIGNADYESGKDERLMSDESKIDAVKLMDLYVGLASVVFDKDPTAPLRRRLYGKAGEFRPTKYGIEYRVLGNYALRSRRVTQLVIDLTMLAMSHIEAGTAKKALGMMQESDTIRIINESDRMEAFRAICTLKLPYQILSEIVNHNHIPTSDALGVM